MKHIKLFEQFTNEESKIARKTNFNADTEADYEGWTFDEDWNGFEVPYFEKDVADKITKDLNGTYDASKDCYKFEDEEDFSSQTINTTDGEKKVYCIGGYTWVWSEIK